MVDSNEDFHGALEKSALKTMLINIQTEDDTSLTCKWYFISYKGTRQLTLLIGAYFSFTDPTMSTDADSMSISTIEDDKGIEIKLHNHNPADRKL